MPQYRKDPLTGRWVVVAEERASRPNQFDIEGVSADDITFCPFCANNEDQTPAELDRIENSDSGGWAARAVPNKYAAVLRSDEFRDSRAFQSHYGRMLDADCPLSEYEDSFCTPIPGIGSHELIVDTPRHILCLSEMTEQEVFDMFRMYRKRLSALKQENQNAFALIFKNVGQAAGASIYHSHSQLLAMPFLTPSIQRELQRAIGFHRETAECFWCVHLAKEIENGKRIIEETPRFVSLCPYVSRFPAETEIFPKNHQSHFEEIDEESLWDLATLTRRTVILLTKGVDWIKGRLAYNLILKSGPFVYSGPTGGSDSAKPRNDSCENAYHFHLTILPSLAKAAGFEWGCGLHINPVAPETAAAKLRQIRELIQATRESE